MKSTQIKKLLRGVYRNFLETITDEKVKKTIKNNSFVSGGCIPSMLLDDFVNDYDIYFVDKESVDIVRNYFSDKTNFIEKEKYVPIFITENAITLSNKIQLITKFYGTPYEVTNKFDWEHIKSYFRQDELYLDDKIYKNVIEKELIYTGSGYPLSSLFRLQKYIKKGWNVSNITTLRIVLDLLKILTTRKKENMVSLSSDTDFLIEEVEEESLEEELTHNKVLIYEEEVNNFKIDVDELINQMNGVDPIVIQDRLDANGEMLTISEIIEKLEN